MLVSACPALPTGRWCDARPGFSTSPMSLAILIDLSFEGSFYLRGFSSIFSKV